MIKSIGASWVLFFCASLAFSNPQPVPGVMGVEAAMESPTEAEATIRDPFTPKATKTNDPILSQEGSFSIHQLKLLGVISGTKQNRALILAPNGKTFFVTEESKIGSNGAVVKRIGPRVIKIMEKVSVGPGRTQSIVHDLKLTGGG